MLICIVIDTGQLRQAVSFPEGLNVSTFKPINRDTEVIL